MLTKAVLDHVRTIFASVCADFGAERVEREGEDDHGHRLVTSPPKGGDLDPGEQPHGHVEPPSAPETPSPAPPLLEGGLWSHGYLTCGGAPLAILRQSIDQHRTPG